MEFGNPDKQKDLKDLKDFVLEKINKEERKILDEAIETGAKAIVEIIENGVDIAMNKYN